ncbi:bleomycin resistance protein [Cyanobium sp. Copco_Reservoir_LC18]|uniref:VOC family protein n=1 Tax=Cyanobium sp. Copco_Reservoir_LC18 TaxID=1328305 RepID=UPI00169939AE|nr:VOC family protein [Cyanobium sp. Copco_Reservoir_LC18]KAF0654186.1 bleomycin resistance protein [Cyanobium sp. Copco_Reservoir_LC18]
MLGEPGGTYHFEFTTCRHHPVLPTPTPDDLIVFFVPDRQEWLQRCQTMESAGFKSVGPFNPYWEQQGRTFEDHDGYRIVLQGSSWNNRTE